MKEIKDFNTEKNIFIGKVLNHIDYKKLHTRIYEELSNHMEDMYEDFRSTCDNEIEITRKILNEMGNPDELGEELKKANKKTLTIIKALRIIRVIVSIPISICMVSLGIFIFDEIMVYFHAEDIPEIETYIIEEYNDGNPINLLTEIKHNGETHRIYVPETQDDEFDIYHIVSIKVFGINIKSKFEFAHSTYCSSDEYTLADLEKRIGLSDVLFIYFDNPEEEYIKVQYISLEDNSTGPWSDFIKIPQNGTRENPQCVLFDCPDGYRWSHYKRFDKNKEPIEWEKT